MRKLFLVLGLLAAAGGGYYGVERYRYRFVHSDEDLLRFLPQTDASTFYVNVAALRRAGYLNVLDGAKATQATEYLQFVRETGFDYSRDIDAMAGAAAGQQIWFVLRGRFDWGKLREYVKRHGGQCGDGNCGIATSTAGRRASFRSVQPDVMALGISSDSDAAAAMQQSAAEAMPSTAPVWMKPSHALLTNPTQLPLALRIFAISLESSDSLLVSLRQSEQKEDAFSIEVDSVFGNQPTAETARKQLEIDTGLVKQELAREHKPADPADLTGLLTSGVFQVEQRHMIGTWRVRRELLQALR
ncbi:MAG TPA: hypothetical protein VHZ55_23500 [Bryobacteraceae bacterium]|nr:hypothetical protein [Bryobacteraceae bacterium]